MRKKDSPPYCFLETAIPVRHMAFDEHFKEVEVLRPYRFHSWWPAKDLAQLIKLAEGSIKMHGWKYDPKAGTVNDIAMRCIPSDTYPDEQFTAAELKAPPGYRYWRVNTKTNTVTLLCMWFHVQERLKKNRRLWKMIVNDPRYLAPITVDLPEGWVSTKSDNEESGYLADRIEKQKLSFDQALVTLKNILTNKSRLEIEATFDYPNQEELVTTVFRLRQPSNSHDKIYWEVAGDKFEDSPQVLYRAMHYFGKTKLTELYKGHLVRLHHPEGLAFIDIGTWKCEMEARLFVDKTQCQQIKPASAVRAGFPGSHSDEIKAPDGALNWYKLLIKLLQTKTMIYGGNNFEV